MNRYLIPNTGINYSGFAETSYAAPGAATVTTICDEVLFHDVNHRLLQRLVITKEQAELKGFEMLRRSPPKLYG